MLPGTVAVLGDRLQVRTRLQIKARGVALVFHHELWRLKRDVHYGVGLAGRELSRLQRGGRHLSQLSEKQEQESDKYELVMKGVVTIYSIKESTKEPSPIPDWLLQQTHSFVVSKG